MTLVGTNLTRSSRIWVTLGYGLFPQLRTSLNVVVRFGCGSPGVPLRSAVTRLSGVFRGM
jgi:hypothetical protein